MPFPRHDFFPSGYVYPGEIDIPQVLWPVAVPFEGADMAIVDERAVRGVAHVGRTAVVLDDAPFTAVIDEGDNKTVTVALPGKLRAVPDERSEVVDVLPARNISAEVDSWLS